MFQKKSAIILILIIVVIAFQFCSKSDAVTPVNPTDPYAAIKATFGTNIDPANLANYASQGKPNSYRKTILFLKLLLHL